MPSTPGRSTPIPKGRAPSDRRNRTNTTTPPAASISEITKPHTFLVRTRTPNSFELPKLCLGLSRRRRRLSRRRLCRRQPTRGPLWARRSQSDDSADQASHSECGVEDRCPACFSYGPRRINVVHRVCARIRISEQPLRSFLAQGPIESAKTRLGRGHAAPQDAHAGEYEKDAEPADPDIHQQPIPSNAQDAVSN